MVTNVEARHVRLPLGHGATCTAQVGAHDGCNVVNHLVRARVRVALETATRTVVRMAIDAPVAAAEALRVHTRVVAHVVQPRVHPCHGHLRLAGLGHLHLHDGPQGCEVVGEQSAQPAGGFVVGVALLGERRQRVQEAAEGQAALKLGFGLREYQVHFRACHPGFWVWRWAPARRCC